MKQIQIKINFPQQYTLIKIDEHKTVQDLVKQLLTKQQINALYSNVCGIIKMQNNMAELLNQDKLISEIYDKLAKYDFKILHIPGSLKIDQIQSLQFRQLLYQQTQLYVLKSIYSIRKDNLDLIYQLAAFSCGICFGSYKNKYQKEFLNQILNTLVPLQFIPDDSSAIRDRVIKEWSNLSRQGFVNDDKIQNIINYLGACKEFIKEYGYYVMNGRFNYITCKICVNDQLLQVTDMAGNLIDSYNIVNSKITYLDKKTIEINKAKVKPNNFQNIKDLIEFLVNFKYPETELQQSQNVNYDLDKVDENLRKSIVNEDIQIIEKNQEEYQIQLTESIDLNKSQSQQYSNIDQLNIGNV